MFGSAHPVGRGGLPAAASASGARDEPGPAASSLAPSDLIAWHVARGRLDRILGFLDTWPAEHCSCDLCRVRARRAALAG